MFIAALYVTAKRWKQPKYPWTDGQKNKMWYTYNGVPFSLKRNEALPNTINILNTIEVYTQGRWRWKTKEGNSDTCHNVDEPWRHDAK